MAINEEIVTGRKFRKLIDEATKLWQRISFWTKASDVEFDDGSTAETKMGAINGITDSLASTSSNIAASAKALNQLNNKLTSQLPGDVKLITEGSGANTKYYVQVGADTASKKILRSTPKVIGTLWSPNETEVSFIADDDYDNVFVCTSDIRTGYLRLKINDVLASVTETTLISSAVANRPAGIVTINQKIHARDKISVKSIGGGALCFFIA